MRISHITLVALVCTAARAGIPTLIHEVADAADVTAFTGGGGADPLCLELLADGRIAFFDTAPGVDAVLVFDPGSSGFTEIASEAELLATYPGGGSPTNVNVTDLARDGDDNLFAMVSETTGFENWAVMIPNSSGVFQTPVLATDLFNGGKSSQGDFTYNRIEVNSAGTTLHFHHDNLSTANDAGVSPGVNGIYTFDTSLIPGTTANLQLLMPYQSLAAAVTPAATPGTTSLGLTQIRLSPDGATLYSVNTNGTGNNDGDIVAVNTSTGAVSLFVDNDDSEYHTDHPSQFTTATAIAVNPTNGNLTILEHGTATAAREHLYEYAPDATFLGIVHTHDQIVAAVPGVGSNFDLQFTNAIDVAPNGDVFFWMCQATETLIRAESTLKHPLTGSPGWIWPIPVDDSPLLSSAFASRLLSHPGGPYDWHRGLDIPLPWGSRVYAVADGTIRLAGVTSGYSDPVVQVRHGSGPSAIYTNSLHVSGWPVPIGTPVQQGDLVAITGESMASGTGFEHLHFEVRVGGTSQQEAKHPLGYLSYTDTVPAAPVFAGANLDPAGAVILLDTDTSRSEIDLLGFGVSWGADFAHFSFDDINGANPGVSTDLDHPPLGLGPRVNVGVFPGRTSSDYVYRFLVWGLDPTAVTGLATINDIDESSASTVLTPALPPVTIAPAVISLDADPGDTVVFNHTLTNLSTAPRFVSLSATSAQRNDITINPMSTTLGPSASVPVTVTVDHRSDVPSGVGDCIVLEIDSGTAQNLIAVETINDPFEIPIAVPVGLAILGAQ
jgi:murein DD-endopeptidase MepM/ murein hydrolase activator NlpD